MDSLSPPPSDLFCDPSSLSFNTLEGLFLGAKRQKREGDQLSPSRDEVKTPFFVMW
jgi:hypothetical protein